MSKVRKRIWGDGKEAWVVDYADRSKTRRAKTFAKKKDADAYLLQVQTEVKDGTHMAPSQSMSVAQAIPGWLHDAENGTHNRAALEQTTVREYTRLSEYLCDPLIGVGNIKLSELNYQDVLAFERRLAASGKSTMLVKTVRTALSGVLSDAMIKGLVAQNVIVKAPRQKRPKDRKISRIVPPTKEDIHALIQGAQGRMRAIVVTLIFTGMRISELRGLYWERVDFDRRVIEVVQRADRYGTIGDPKSKAGTRTIPMTPMVANTLREWKLRCPPGELVFATRHGGVIAHSNLAPMFTRLQKRLGVAKKDGKPYGFHALRHAAASLFIEQDFNPKKVQTLLGHASIQMTYDRYGHLFHDEGDDEAFAEIEASIFATKM